MDPISIFSTVLSTSIAISQWVDNLKSKEAALLDLKNTVSSVTLVLQPLQQKAADGSLSSQPGVVACLRDIGETMDKAREHLQTWHESYSRKTGNFPQRILAFLDPVSVLDQVKDDRTSLDQKIGILSLAIQLAWLGNNAQQAAPSTTSPLDFIFNAEARAFWTQAIGLTSEHSFCCPSNVMRSALNTWLGSNIEIPSTLMLQLDESGFGGITPSSFDRFVGSQSLIQAFTNFAFTHPYAPQTQGFNRLIIWVVDERDIPIAIVEYAQSLNIEIKLFFSMASAKSWMEQNDPLIRATADSHRLRFISDNVRNECGIFNATAGETFLRYIRGRQLASPCLIFAASVNTTAYVAEFLRAGSTTDVQIVRGYIKALAAGVRDLEWVGFCVGQRQSNFSTSVLPPSSLEDCCLMRPLLVYVTGSKPEQDQFLINYAMALGITVVAFPTITNLKTWMKTNEAHLRRTAAAHRLRFVTQNVRWEDGVLVTSAGEETIAHIRNAEGYPSPVLVLCSSSIAHTQFVAQYGRAGSTTDTRVVRGFMDALAAGVRDTAWVGFNAQ